MAIKLTNNAVSRLAAGINNSTTTLNVTPGEGARFPSLGAEDWFPCTLIDVNGNIEIIRVTARATDGFTIVRAQEGTAARAFSAGDRVELRLTAGTMQGFFDENEVEVDAKIAAASAALAPSLVPAGVILMWSGAIANIPSGWALCNGSNGTPDLRNRFIVGAGSTYAVADTGGADSVTLTTAQLPSHTHDAGTLAAASGGGHTHTGTAASNGAHTHNVQYGTGSTETGTTRISAHSGWASTASMTGAALSAGAHTHSLTVDSGGAHTHSISGSTGALGSGSSHENRPPYYALAYIMKL